MTIGSDYADDLKNEVLSEMADNFFSRRCRLDERLENFASLLERVKRRATPAVDAVQNLRRLLLCRRFVINRTLLQRSFEVHYLVTPFPSKLLIVSVLLFLR